MSHEHRTVNGSIRLSLLSICMPFVWLMFVVVWFFFSLSLHFLHLIAIDNTKRTYNNILTIKSPQEYMKRKWSTTTKNDTKTRDTPMKWRQTHKENIDRSFWLTKPKTQTYMITSCQWMIRVFHLERGFFFHVNLDDEQQKCQKRQPDKWKEIKRNT